MMKAQFLQGIYAKILDNKFVTVCVLFTIFTMLDTIIILLGWYPPKNGMDTYVHLFSRFVLQSLVVTGLFFYDFLWRKLHYKIVSYFVSYLITLGILLLFLWIGTLFYTMHPDAFIYASISYSFMFFLVGVFILLFHKTKSF